MMSAKNLSFSIAELMQSSGVTFGTSGARGLVANMTDQVCYAYTVGFLQYLRQTENQFATNGLVGIAGDLRPSTPRIMAACAQAVADLGLQPINCGYIPTPAITLWGIKQNIPTLMVTGSHIPDDRNGIKLNDSTGEILKDDEAGIGMQHVSLPAAQFTSTGALLKPNTAFLSQVNQEAKHTYQRRYLDFFPPQCLAGLRIGLYQHSSVSRDILYDILIELGALVTPLSRSEKFIPVDTEAVRAEDWDLARVWAASNEFDCIISTDGDGDRPLIADENGIWLRGDIVGILTARYLGINVVVTPVSSNSALELSGWFSKVKRTRIGSPYVIVSMAKAVIAGLSPVAGYEANGGFLLANSLLRNERTFAALPTRDAVIVILSLLLFARKRGCSIAQLVQTLPQRYTASGRLQNFPIEISHKHIAELTANAELRRIEFAAPFDQIQQINTIDGLRMTFGNNEILHLRPSGNAPELRVYAEANSAMRAEVMVQKSLSILDGWRN